MDDDGKMGSCGGHKPVRLGMLSMVLLLVTFHTECARSLKIGKFNLVSSSLLCANGEPPSCEFAQAAYRVFSRASSLFLAPVSKS